MKTFYLLTMLAASVLSFNYNVTATAFPPNDTLRISSYALSSRNSEAQSGKYKKIDIKLNRTANPNTFSVQVKSERPIDAYLEISDQDENVIYFKQVQFQDGLTSLTFEAEDGVQSLFRFSFQEPNSKPAVFIVREEGPVSSLASEAGN